MLTAAPQKQNQAPSQSKKSAEFFFQPTLTINQPNDVYEQQAGTVADKVMRMPETSPPLADNKPFFSPPTTNINRAGATKEDPFKKEIKGEETEESIPEIQAKLSFDALPPPPDDNKENNTASIQRKCAHCEEEERTQRKEMNSAQTVADASTESYISSLNGKGRSLASNERKFFEPKMGYDFSNVQLHTNEEASQSAKSMNALAYTHGNNIVFGSGQYQPNTDDGKKLLAHELTHVVQQINSNKVAKGIQRTKKPGDIDDDPWKIVRTDIPRDRVKNPTVELWKTTVKPGKLAKHVKRRKFDKLLEVLPGDTVLAETKLKDLQPGELNKILTHSWNDSDGWVIKESKSSSNILKWSILCGEFGKHDAINVELNIDYSYMIGNVSLHLLFKQAFIDTTKDLSNDTDFARKKARKINEDIYKAGSVTDDENRLITSYTDYFKGNALTAFQSEIKTAQEIQNTTKYRLATLYVLADILNPLTNPGSIKELNSANPFKQYLLDLLSVIAAGAVAPTQKPADAGNRRKIFDLALKGLNPVIDFYLKDPNYKSWIEETIVEPIQTIRKDVYKKEAEERLEGSILIDGKIFESSDENPHEQAIALRPYLQKLVVKLGLLTEYMETSGDAQIEKIEEQIKELERDGKEYPGKEILEQSKEGGNLLNSIKVVHGLLYLADGYITLSDDEFHHKLAEVQKSSSIFEGVQTYTEFLNSILKVTYGTVVFVGLIGWGIAKIAGDAELAADALGLVVSSEDVVVGKFIPIFGKVITALEVVIGIFELITADTNNQRLAAGVHIGLGALVLAGQGTAAASVFITYEGYKYLAEKGWLASLGLSRLFLTPVFDDMLTTAKAISENNDKLKRAGMLKNKETKPDKLKAFQSIEKDIFDELVRDINGFLDRCLPQPGNTHIPGSNDILVEVFEPLQSLKDAKTIPDAEKAADIIVDKIIWCLKIWEDISRASTSKMTLTELEQYEKDKQTKSKEPKDKEDTETKAAGSES